MRECTRVMRSTVDERILQSFDRHIALARAAATPEATSWDRFLWSTYQAVCRRKGFFPDSGCGIRCLDFNADLVGPITNQLATTWERTFNLLLPRALEEFSSTCNGLLEGFHKEAIAEKQEDGRYIAVVRVLEQQLQTHRQ